MRIVLAGLLVLGTLTIGFTNNISVTDVALRPAPASVPTRTIQFDVGWENSWRFDDGPANWDAAYIFVKYQVSGGEWSHATLADIQPQSGASVFVTPDAVGAFIHRSAPGVGDVFYDDLLVDWDYLADGVTTSEVVRVQVFAIEMVYVPEGAFDLGTGGTETSSFYVDGGLVGSDRPYRVTSEDEVSMGSLSPDFTYRGAALDGNLAVSIEASFPKGFAAFYCMKYETSQAQYVEYLNSLSESVRVSVGLSASGAQVGDLLTYRNGMYWQAGAVAATVYPAIPISWLSAEQVTAYLDWSGLRPMTEFEYEKACRGTLAAKKSEYAWGSTSLYSTAYLADAAGYDNEYVTNPGTGASEIGNALCNTNRPMTGPLRNGIFAGSASSLSRAASGASYYGIMELSGNLGEFVVTVNNPAGREYTGNHGDGLLSALGLGGLLNWVTGNTAFGVRGGSFDDTAAALRVSDRRAATTSYSASPYVGFRGVRTAQ
ncbi:formylglycine-generating enzyme family protein [Lewinella sp. IMCC34183]|uniref:formylglycine-generating enzyme family protein n=1 Tax=Lewinella sp. IMCC34183 TaxID=2248762 RepID=UPI000E27DFD1|nr:SUMF1/EgtB/PvdO family nonheme iron enzyme [Lewinella sp. IMCC34183]